MDITEPSQDDKVSFCITDFYKSLIRAAAEAGGNVGFIVKRAEHTSVAELAAFLATNGVRFVYDKRRHMSEVTTVQTMCFKQDVPKLPVAK